MNALEKIIKEVENLAKEYHTLVTNCKDEHMKFYYNGKLDGFTHSLAILKSAEERLERNEEAMVSKMETAWYKTRSEKWLGDL